MESFPTHSTRLGEPRCWHWTRKANTNLKYKSLTYETYVEENINNSKHWQITPHGVLPFIPSWSFPLKLFLWTMRLSPNTLFWWQFVVANHRCSFRVSPEFLCSVVWGVKGYSLLISASDGVRSTAKFDLCWEAGHTKSLYLAFSSTLLLLQTRFSFSTSSYAHFPQVALYSDPLRLHMERRL